MVQDSSSFSGGLERVKQHNHDKVSKERKSMNKEIVFAQLDEQVSHTKVWKTFKQICHILDISFPKKRDKFGNRFGFVKTKNPEGAATIMEKGRKILFNGKPVRLDWVRDMNNKKNKDTIKTVISEQKKKDPKQLVQDKQRVNNLPNKSHELQYVEIELDDRAKVLIDNSLMVETF